MRLFLFTFRPIPASFQINFQRYGQVHHARHLVAHQRLEIIQFLRRAIEDQLIVDLQEHFALPPFGLQPPVDVEHRKFHQISGASLDDGVNRRPLG